MTNLRLATITAVLAALLAIVPSAALVAGPPQNAAPSAAPGGVVGETATAPAETTHAKSLWLVDSRYVSGCTDDGETTADELRIAKQRRCGEREESDLEAMRQALEDGRPVVVFIHGNLMPRHLALRATWHLRSVFEEDAAGADAAHYVTWLWPSGRVHRRVRIDAQIKAQRSNRQARYLADWLSAVQPPGRIILVGYSYGARSAGGAARLLCGKAFRGMPPVESAEYAPAGLSVVWIAPAMNASWAAPGGELDLQEVPLENLLVTANRHDPALRWYKHLWGCGGSPALGFLGAGYWGISGHPDTETRVVDLSCQVGRTHEVDAYLSSLTLASQLQALASPAHAAP